MAVDSVVAKAEPELVAELASSRPSAVAVAVFRKAKKAEPELVAELASVLSELVAARCCMQLPRGRGDLLRANRLVAVWAEAAEQAISVEICKVQKRPPQGMSRKDHHKAISREITTRDVQKRSPQGMSRNGHHKGCPKQITTRDVQNRSPQGKDCDDQNHACASGREFLVMVIRDRERERERARERYRVRERRK